MVAKHSEKAQTCLAFLQRAATNLSNVNSAAAWTVKILQYYTIKKHFYHPTSQAYLMTCKLCSDHVVIFEISKLLAFVYRFSGIYFDFVFGYGF